MPAHKTAITRNCGNCGKVISVRPSWVRPVNFCSHLCSSEYRRRDAGAQVCGWCGQILKLVPAKVRPVNFCSRQCSGRYRQGKPFHSKETKEILRQLSTGQAASPKTIAMMKQRRGELHPRWKGDEVVKHSAYTRCQNWHTLKACEVCGGTPQEKRINRHHKDENPYNNTEENIAFLCVKHHKAAHKELKRRKQAWQSLALLTGHHASQE